MIPQRLLDRKLAIALLFAVGMFPRNSRGQIGTDVDWGYSVQPQPGLQRPMMEQPRPSGPSAADWMNFGGRLLDMGIRESQRQQQQQSQQQYWQPRSQRSEYYQQRQPYRQPYRQQQSYAPTPAPAPVAPAAPRNEIVKNKAKSNELDFSPIRLRASAETDARQQVEAEQSKAMLDADLLVRITNGGNAAVINDWKEVLRKGGTTADVEAFLAKYGPAGNNTLTADVLADLDLRQKFSRYGDDLANGTLTEMGKRQALDDLQLSVAAAAAKPGANTTFYGTLASNVTEMNNFNTMGQLADATQGTANPFPVLVQGAQQMGMPVMFVSEMTGFPVMGIDPIPDVVEGKPASILICNPEANGQAISYLLDAHRFDMAAGAQQRLDRSYQISFDPGAGGGTKRYQLADGVYEWSRDSESGWKLFKSKINVVIDNSRYDGEFRYLLNNEHKSVAAGEVAEHSSDRLLEVTFDSGKGGTPSRKVLKSGRYIVGLDPDRGLLDLFDAAQADAAAAKTPEYLASTAVEGSNATQSQRVAALLAQLRPVTGAAGAGESALTSKSVSPLGNASGSKQSVEDLLNSIKKKSGAGGG